MSGDNIHMDYYSVLGPIDPQVEGPNGNLVPATGYLEKYKQLIEKSRDGTITSAEINYLVQKFDAAELYGIEQAQKHSVALLEHWLAKYKFKDWKTTDGTGKRVTPSMKKKRASEIAGILNNVDRWNSHGRGIPMSILVSEEIKLKIEDFGVDSDLSSMIRSYHGLAVDFCKKQRAKGVIHTPYTMQLV